MILPIVVATATLATASHAVTPCADGYVAVPGVAHAMVLSDSSDYVFDESCAQEVNSADSLPEGYLNCRTNDESVSREAVRIDLNDDGAAEYILRCRCGDRGCEYAIIDGQTKQLLGRVAGTRIHVFAQRANGYAVLEAFAPKPDDTATLTRLVFDGTSYVIDRSDLLTGVGVKWLLEKFDDLPKPPRRQ